MKKIDDRELSQRLTNIENTLKELLETLTEPETEEEQTTIKLTKRQPTEEQ